MPFLGFSVSVPLREVLIKKKAKALPEWAERNGKPVYDTPSLNIMFGSGSGTPPQMQTQGTPTKWDPECGCWVIDIDAGVTAPGPTFPPPPPSDGGIDWGGYGSGGAGGGSIGGGGSTSPYNPPSTNDPIRVNLPRTIATQVGPNLCVPTIMAFLLQYMCSKGDYNTNLNAIIRLVSI